MTTASEDATQPGTSTGDEPDARSRARAIEPGAVIGRHVVMQKLGAGGMGVVYAAYDPELDRKVALKLLLPGSGGNTRRLRLLREAQALARLSHPSVVGIHDVGTVGEQVWLAMEFVQGRTLRQWLATPRRWPEVLEVLRKAGEGLAAAHAADLLHRDFKPDNVMVGDDGRVRVMDFGLARASSGSPESDGDPASPGPERRRGLTDGVTRLGAVVGTPSYMAPEQIAGKELTAAADQFAFCITLWEALYGERPFGGDTSPALVADVLEGKLRSPTRSRVVPGWLRRTCERGLSSDPGQRWPSMSALLDTLAKGRRRAAVRKGLAGVVMLALLGAGWQAKARWDLAERTASCNASGDEIATAWNPEREQALRDGLVGTGLGYARATADEVAPLLEERAIAWREARVQACLDTHVHGRWGGDELDRSLWCLDERRMELQSLVDELAAADAVVLQHAITAAAGLSPLEPCRDVKVLEMLSPPPEEAREALGAVRADVVRAHNLERAGRYTQGVAVAREALARAEVLGWPPLVAVARLGLGRLLDRAGAYPEAETELERAYFDASKGVAPEVAFDAALVLAYVVGRGQGRFADGRHWARLADVALADVPDAEHLHRAALLGAFASIDRRTGDYDQAKVELEQALAFQQAALGSEHPGLTSNLSILASVHHATGDAEQAKLLYERAITIARDTLGPEHPLLAIDVHGLATVYHATGDHDQAKVLLEQALAIWKAALPPEHPHVAGGLIDLGNVHHTTGDYDQARALIEQGLAIQERALGPEHPSLARALVGLARVALAQHRPGEAIALAERAVTLRENGGVAAELLAEARFELARALWEAPTDAGRDRARSLAERARDALRAAGTDETKLATVEAWLAAPERKPLAAERAERSPLPKPSEAGPTGGG